MLVRRVRFCWVLCTLGKESKLSPEGNGGPLQGLSQVRSSLISCRVKFDPCTTLGSRRVKQMSVAKNPSDHHGDSACCGSDSGLREKVDMSNTEEIKLLGI